MVGTLGRLGQLAGLTIAGGLAHLSGFPLGWMLGPAALGLVCACLGRPIGSDGRVGDVGRAILGAAVGGTLSGGHFLVFVDAPALLLIVLIYVLLSGLVGSWWLRSRCGWSPATAWFAALPGGLSEMVELAKQQPDAKPHWVALSHTLRVFWLVLGAATLTALLSDFRFSPAAFGTVSGASLVLLAISVLLGLWVGRVLSLPAPSVIGPLCVAAVLALSLELRAVPNEGLVLFAQFAIGWSLAHRFMGSSATQVRRCVVHVAGLLAALVPIWLAAVVAAQWAAGGTFQVWTLGLAPGGQAEMALLALLLGAAPAVVVALHLVRVLMITASAGWLYRRFG